MPALQRHNQSKIQFAIEPSMKATVLSIYRLPYLERVLEHAQLAGGRRAGERAAACDSKSIITVAYPISRIKSVRDTLSYRKGH